MHKFILSQFILLLLSSCTLTAQQEDTATHWIAIDKETKIHYQRAGKGPSMLLVPGWTFGSAIFAQQIAHFSSSYDVIAMDPRGQGKSTKAAYNNTYSQHGTDIASMLQSLNIDKSIMVGWSWGCYDILAYVRQYGVDKISRFICIDEPPSGWSNNKGDWARLFSLESFAGLYQVVATNRVAFTEEFTKSMVTRPLTTSELATLTAMSYQTPDHIALALAVDGMMSDYAEEARLLDQTVPTLFLVEESHEAASTSWLKKHMPNTQTHFNGGHLMFWEFPDATNAVIDQFLQ